MANLLETHTISPATISSISTLISLELRILIARYIWFGKNTAKLSKTCQIISVIIFLTWVVHKNVTFILDYSNSLAAEI